MKCIVATLLFARRDNPNIGMLVYLTANGEMFRIDTLEPFYADPQFFRFKIGDPADGEVTQSANAGESQPTTDR